MSSEPYYDNDLDPNANEPPGPIDTGGKVTFQVLNADVKDARAGHDEYFYGAGRGNMAYRYQETDQKPENFPDKVKYFAQMNIVKEDIEALNGMLSQSKFSWDVKGRARGSYDKRRVNVHTKVMEWAAKEARVRSATLEALRDFNTCGMAYLNHSFDKYKKTGIDTMGMVAVERRDPANMRLDPQGGKVNGLGGRYLIYDQQITRNQFMARYGNHRLPNGKFLDADKIFKSIKSRGHFDHNIINNSRKSSHDDKLSLIQYDYSRWVQIPLNDPITKEPIMMDDNSRQVMIPSQEFRIAIAAGNEILTDTLSDVSGLGLFSSIIYGNNPWRRGPYSVANFLEIKNIQDLLNIMLSMTINSQARQMNSPILMLAGAAKNLNAMIQSMGGYEVITYDYTQEMMDSGIPLDAAKPSRLEHGNMDQGFFTLMNWILSASDRLRVKDVAKGQASSGVRSGVAINSLQQAALLPQRYTQEKLEEPMQALGAALHHRLRNHLDYEFELPIAKDERGTQGLTVNRVVPFNEIAQWVAEAQEDNERRIDLEMVTIRTKDAETVTLREWQKTVDPSVFADENAFKANFEGLEFIENDFTFGSFAVGMTVDTTAQENKAQRTAQGTIMMEAMSNAGAPLTSLEYGLETSEIPDSDEWLEKVKAESEIHQLGLQAKAQMEEEQKAAEAEQSGEGSAPQTA